jgi:hypothetical protein
MTVCFASFEGFEGCVQSCRNAAAILGGECAVIPRTGDPPATVMAAGVLVLSSWHERYEPILARRKGPVVPRWHSALIQSDLAEEQDKIARIIELLDRRVVSAVAADDLEFARALGRDDVVYLPNVLAEASYHGVAPAPLRGVHVSLFGTAEGRKNIMVQSAAFERARRAAGDAAWMLHLNGQSFADRGYDRWLEAARIPYVDHGWLDRTAYLSLVAAMHAGLCATLSESYCYVAADHVALRVPIVASPAIACLGDDSPRARPDRVDEVAAALAAALAARDDVATRQRQSLFAQAHTNALIARAALVQINAFVRAGVLER